MKPPKLIETDIDNAMAALLGVEPGVGFITMAPSQWDALLEAAYDDGWTLIELGQNEVPVKAYRRVGDN